MLEENPSKSVRAPPSSRAAMQLDGEPFELLLQDGLLGRFLTADVLARVPLVCRAYQGCYQAWELRLWRACAEAAWGRDDHNDGNTPVLEWMQEAVEKQNRSFWHLVAQYCFSSAPEVVHYFVRSGLLQHGRDLRTADCMRALKARPLDATLSGTLQLAVEVQNLPFIAFLCRSAFAGKQYLQGWHDRTLDGFSPHNSPVSPYSAGPFVWRSILWTCVHNTRLSPCRYMPSHLLSTAQDIFLQLLNCGGVELVCTQDSKGLTVMQEVVFCARQNGASEFRCRMYWVAQKLYEVSRRVVQTERPQAMSIRQFRRYKEWLVQRKLWPVLEVVSSDEEA